MIVGWSRSIWSQLFKLNQSGLVGLDGEGHYSVFIGVVVADAEQVLDKEDVISAIISFSWLSLPCLIWSAEAIVLSDSVMDKLKIERIARLLSSGSELDNSTNSVGNLSDDLGHRENLASKRASLQVGLDGHLVGDNQEKGYEYEFHF